MYFNKDRSYQILQSAIPAGGLVELPAYTLNAPLVAKFGRRLPSAGCFFVCAAALAFLPLLSKGAFV